MNEMISSLIDSSRMLTRLDVNGYRGLKELSLTDTGRINLIVGRNDTGKTSLLEAIRLLLSGDPRYLRRTNRNRMERRLIDPEQEYRLAFYQSKGYEPLSISGAFGGVHLSAQAVIQEVQEEENLPEDLDNDGDTPETIESLLQPGYEVVVEVKTDKGAIARIRQPLRGRDVSPIRSRRQFTGAAFPDVPQLVWLGTNRAEIWSHARRYSALYRTGGASLLLTILKDIEPRLQSLVVLTSQDAHSPAAVLEVDLGLSHSLPLDSMGDGFSSVIAILSAIGAAENGICLVDEVENGVHYSLLTQIWRSVLSASEKYNSQVWATTHSYDCVNAIYEALSETPDALRVHRLDRKQDGVVAVHTFDHAMLGRALERGLEVR